MFGPGVDDDGPRTSSITVRAREGPLSHQPTWRCLTRASTSIVLNLAEGAGKLSKADKRRFYLTARGSATESAALLEHRTGKAMIVRVVSMLIKLAMSFENPSPASDKSGI